MSLDSTPPLKLLFVDDDEDFLLVTTLALKPWRPQVSTCAHGSEALEWLKNHDVDAVICDVNMPVLDGFSFCRLLRQQGRDVPVVLLTHRDSPVDEVTGLHLGADDFVSKPVVPEVLMARIKAAVRRATPQPLVPLSALPRFDLERLEALWPCGGTLALPPRELSLLRDLVRHVGRVRSRHQLLDAIRQDPASTVAPRMVDVYIARLRKRLALAPFAEQSIETVTGLGYRWLEESSS